MFAFLWGMAIGIAVGITIGRAYGWMKYHYPEFRAELDLRVARTRAEEAKYKTEETRERLAENQMYDKLRNS